MNKKSIFVIYLIFIIFSSCDGLSEPLPVMVEKITLPNSMEAYLRPRSDAVLSIRLGVRVGSTSELLGERGMAHFLEHMGFRGFRGEDQSILEQAQNRNARINAYTSLYQTVYEIDLREISESNVRWALEVARDWSRNMKIGKDEFEMEKLVVLEELRLSSSTPAGQGRSSSMIFLFDGYQGHQHHILGTEEDLLAIKPEEMMAFYQAFYRPENMVLTLTGATDRIDIRALLEEVFIPHPMPWTARNIQKPFTRISPPTKTHIAIIPDLKENQITLHFPLESRGSRNTQWARLIKTQFLGQYLQTGLRPLVFQDSSPLKNLNMRSDDNPWTRDHFSLVLDAEIHEKKEEEALKFLVESLASFLSSPWDQESYERERDRFLRNLNKMDFASAGNINLPDFLTNWVLWKGFWIPDLSQKARETLGTLDPSSLQSWARTMIRPETLRAQWLLEKEPESPLPLVAGAFQDKVEESWLKGSHSTFPTLEVQFSPWEKTLDLEILDRQFFGPWNTTRFQLSTGHRLFLIPGAENLRLQALSRSSFNTRAKKPWISAPYYRLSQGSKDFPADQLLSALSFHGFYLHMGLEEGHAMIDLSKPDPQDQDLDFLFRAFIALLEESTGDNILDEEKQMELTGYRDQQQNSFYYHRNKALEEFWNFSLTAEEKKASFTHEELQRLGDQIFQDQSWDLFLFLPQSNVRIAMEEIEPWLSKIKPGNLPTQVSIDIKKTFQEPAERKISLGELDGGYGSVLYYGTSTMDSLELRGRLEALTFALSRHLFEGLRSETGATYSINIEPFLLPSNESVPSHQYALLIEFQCDPELSLQHSRKVQDLIQEASSGQWLPGVQKWVSGTLPGLSSHLLQANSRREGVFLRNHPQEALRLSSLLGAVKALDLEDITAAAHDLLGGGHSVIVYGP